MPEANAAEVDSGVRPSLPRRGFGWKSDYRTVKARVDKIPLSVKTRAREGKKAADEGSGQQANRKTR